MQKPAKCTPFEPCKKSPFAERGFIVWQPFNAQSGREQKCHVERTDYRASPQVPDHTLAFAKLRDHPATVCFLPTGYASHNLSKFLVVEAIQEKMGHDQIVTRRVRLEFPNVSNKETNAFPERRNPFCLLFVPLVPSFLGSSPQSRLALCYSGTAAVREIGRPHPRTRARVPIVSFPLGMQNVAPLESFQRKDVRGIRNRELASHNSFGFADLYSPLPQMRIISATSAATTRTRSTSTRSAESESRSLK